MELANGLAQWVATSDEFELAAPQVLPILNLRLRGWSDSRQGLAAKHHEIVEEVNRDGQRWISTAVVNGETVIRTMIISYLTEQRHLQGLQAALVAAVSRPAVETAAA